MSDQIEVKSNFSSFSPQSNHYPFGRRAFLAGAAGSLAAGALSLPQSAKAQSDSTPPPIVLFSKHIEWMEYDEMADTLAEMGFDGVDLTVRGGGHVEPNNVEEDLPRAVEAVRNVGLEVYQITTRISGRDEEGADTILRTASALEIPYYRFGAFSYQDYDDIFTQLEAWREPLQALAGMNAYYNIKAGYHLHSGGRNIGVAVWDLHEMLRDVANEWVGVNYDIGHAFAEGSRLAWRVNYRLIAPMIHMASAKDFAWEHDPQRGWRATHPPIGEGIVQWRDILSLMKEDGFQGPISIHVEYDVGGDTEEEHRRNMLDAIRNDLESLRGKMAEVGWA